jgi:aminoglycoside 3-N-acetyltransferase
MSPVGDDIAEMLSRLGGGPVFVHSDPFRTARFIPRSRDRGALIDSHIELLRLASAGRSLWMPAFNYDFPRTRHFDVAHDPSQLGPLPERFRVTRAEWRTEVPMFSASGTGEAPLITWSEDTDPFGGASLFARLVEADGVILYYGDTFHYSTVVHYAERLSGGPPYRYDKIFPGTVTRADASTISGSLNYHVRPLAAGLDYDWAAILTRALEADACVRLEAYPELVAASAGGLTQFLVDDMRRDPFALLDSETRHWVEPALQQVGRRFRIDDFEGPDPLFHLTGRRTGDSE